LRSYFISLLLLFISSNLFAGPIGPNKEYKSVYDFKYDWEAYSSSDKIFKPYIEEDKNQNSAKILRIDLNSFKNAYLTLRNEGPESYLFFNNQFKATFRSKQWQIYSIENIKRELNSDSLCLVLVGSSSLNELMAHIAYKNPIQYKEAQSKKETSISFLSRVDRPFQSILVFSFLFVMFFTSFLGNNFNKSYLRYLNISDLLGKVSKDTSYMVNKPLDRPNILFVILNGIMMVFLMILFSPASKLKVYQDFRVFSIWNGFPSYFLDFVIVLVIVLFLMIFKYFFLRIVGGLFRMDRLVDVHYFKLVQMNLFFYSLLILLGLGNHSLKLIIVPDIAYNTLFYAILFYCIFRVLVVFIALNSMENTNILYNICYLCIVEFFPTLLIFKLFI
jgi:hypothetical protein